MTDWTNFADALDLGPLIPEGFARYRQAIIDGMTAFLERLPEEQTTGILLDQAMLLEDAEIAARLVAIARHCPALHKLAQVLARDRRLPADLRAHLQTLETMPPSQEIGWLRSEIEAEIGSLDALGIRLDEAPLAEASVAIVVPFVWAGGDGKERCGVFKLLKPGIDAVLERELEVLQEIGAILDERCAEYGLPPIAYEDSFLQVRDLLSREVHLDLEQRHLAEARSVYAGDPTVLVPEVFPFSTPRLTAMERIDGGKITEVAGLDEAGRRRLAANIVGALIAGPIWSAEQPSLFHADPHAGNLMLTPDGRIGLLDWSLVGRLGKRERVCMTQILIGALTIDADRIVDAMLELGEGEGDREALAAVVEEALDPVRGGALAGLDWLTALMDATAMTGARYGADLIVFRKVLQTLQGVIADVCDQAGVDAALATAFIGRLLAEWPARLVSPPFSKALATHMSNAELAHLFASSPLIASRALAVLGRS
ncbi:MAG TPA: AarF/ABC1/UbiB kinase family protein [Rhodospirillales bacterium]|nr:AarF/ABC1/UbiB kinase family protein [Rhodospirillales bacterium]